VQVTQAGGTPNYMAPELFNGTRTDEKCDVYSLGCILYEMVARRPPFDELCRAADGGPGGGAGGGGGGNALFRIIVAVAINGQRPKIPEDCPPGGG
jgi:serine/threonine protein kinase